MNKDIALTLRPRGGEFEPDLEGKIVHFGARTDACTPYVENRYREAFTVVLG